MWKKRHPPAGARPGTLVIPEDAVHPTIRVVSYDPDELVEHDDVAVDRIPALIREGAVNWVVVSGLGDEATLMAIAEIFGLHPLVVEDVVNAPQRPKVEDHAGMKLIVARELTAEAPPLIEMDQLSVVLLDGVVLTFAERPSSALDPVLGRIRNGNPRIRGLGGDYLAYAILDALVDGYYPVAEAMGDYLEELEERTLAQPSPETLREIARAKSSLLLVQRTVRPLREALSKLLRDDGDDLISESTHVFLRDTFDHCVQIGDVVETYREMTSDIKGMYLSVVSNRMNEIMKVLTVMASIFIPLTFLAGIYGMNFEVMPELQRPWAYPFLLALMAAIASGMLVFFYRKGWLSGGG